MMMPEFIIEPKSNFWTGIKAFWQYRELLYYFALRDIKVKYKETTLGIAWVLLQPMIMTLLFSLIFSKGLQIQTGPLPYPIFVLSGILFWGFAASCMTEATRSMELNSKIIKKIYFPRMIIPASAVVTSSFDLLLGLVLILAACYYFGNPIHFKNLLTAFPLGLTLLAISAFGFSCMFSVLTVIFKDFKYVIPFFVQVLFFTSPVFYDVKNLGEGWWVDIFEWNPFAGGIQLCRSAISGEILPLRISMKAGFSSLLFFLVGLLIFKKLEPKLADLI